MNDTGILQKEFEYVLERLLAIAKLIDQDNDKIAMYEIGKLQTVVNYNILKCQGQSKQEKQ